MRYTLTFTTFAILIFIVVSCQPPLVTLQNVNDHAYVVAEIDTLYSITMPELYDALNKSNLMPNGGILPASKVKRFLDSIVCDTIAGLLSETVDPAKYYDQYHDYKMAYQDYLMKLYFKKAIYDKIKLDSVTLAEFWANHPEYFTVKEKVLLYHILISPVGMTYTSDSLYYRSLTPAQLEEETRKYALQVKMLLDMGEDFKKVAKEYSQDWQSAKQGGYVGWTTRGIYKNPFDSVAFSLKPGQYSDLYQDPDGWHIVYIEDHIDEGPPPLDSVQLDGAKRILTAQIADSLSRPILDSLNEEIHVVYNEPLLDTNVFLVDKQVWVGILNGIDTIDFNELRTPEEAYRVKYGIKNTTVEMKKEMINQIARKYIIIQAARAMGLDTLASSRAVYKSFRQRFGKNILLSQSRDIGWLPPDSMVERYFNEHKEEFVPKKPLKVQHIITQDSLFGEFLRDQAMAGVDFLELAQQYYPGDESVRVDLANLGEIGPEDVPPEFYKAAILTPVGEVTHPVKTKYGYHVIKVLAKFETPDATRAKHKFLPILVAQHNEKVFEKFRDRMYKQVPVRFPHKISPVHLRSMRYRKK